MQRYESFQTERHQDVSSNSQGQATDIEESSLIPYIAYLLLYLEVSIRASCIQFQPDSQTKVCSNIRPLLQHKTDIS